MAAEDGMPHLKLWSKILEGLRPALNSPALTFDINWPHDSGVPSSCMKRGDSGSCYICLKRFLREATVHVCTPGALEMVIAMPFQKGSILEEGTMRMT